MLDLNAAPRHCGRMEHFAWFENTGLSTWVRESPLVFPTILILHALGMGALVGVSVLFALRALGVTAAVPNALLRAFVNTLWMGFACTLISGVFLLIAYPAKALTNTVFYVKLACVIAAFGTLRALYVRDTKLDGANRARAVAVLALWFAAITAGRLLAYTHHILLASHWVNTR